jgi:hypothetical protein
MQTHVPLKKWHIAKEKPKRTLVRDKDFFTANNAEQISAEHFTLWSPTDNPHSSHWKQAISDGVESWDASWANVQLFVARAIDTARELTLIQKIQHAVF